MQKDISVIGYTILQEEAKFDQLEKFDFISPAAGLKYTIPTEMYSDDHVKL